VLNLATLSTLDLLQTHAAVLDELRSRGVVRSVNNPIADYTEWLVASKLGLELTTNSNAGYDAVGASGAKHQIKSRRAARGQNSINSGVIRNLLHGDFDWLTAVVYEPDFSIRFAAQVPHSVVCEMATFRKHVNGHVLSLRPSILDTPGVLDLTTMLRA
jgi:hypothetical protein